MSSLCSLDEPYDSNLRPRQKNNSDPLEIQTIIAILDIRNINEHDFYFTLQVQLVITWTEHRLRFFRDGQMVTDTMHLSVEQEAAIWRPNMYFIESRGIRNNLETGAKSRIWAPMLRSNGEMVFNERFEIDLTCGFNHSNFPFDHQTCYFRYGVFDLRNSDIIFKAASIRDWTIKTNPNQKIQTSKLGFARSLHTLGQHTFETESGNYSVTGLRIELDRYVHQYVTGYFAPMFLFVVVSWFSFVIHAEQVLVDNLV